MNATVACVADAMTMPPVATKAFPDPLDRDMPNDEVVATTRRGLIRVALVATEVAGRFQREGIALDPMTWMLAPRMVFGGASAVDACVDRDACLRGVLLHGLSLGLDADPAEVDALVDDGGVPAPDPGLVVAGRPDARGAGGPRHDNVLPFRPTGEAEPRLFTARRVVKRATLYIVIDVFSRMIVGFSLSLCPPSWTNAMSAIANCVTDKVAFCAKYGITITEDQWPCRHLGAIIEGDRGEMEKAGVVGLIEQFGVTVENAAAWRADWKGIVESRFRLLQAQFRPYVPGYVEADFGERGGRDYRLDAALDLDGLTKVVIHQILAHNNDTVVGGYPIDPGMVEDGVPAVPREIWNWGIPRVGGMPRQQDEAVVRFALMHRREAVVRRDGIYHQGALYTCRKAIEENWFEKARTGKRFKVWISFDDRDTNVVYVHDRKSPNGFQVATLTAGSAHRADMSFWDLTDTLRQEAVIEDRQRVAGVMGRAGHDAATDAICNEAVEALGGVDLGSARSQVTGINQATAEDRALDAVEEAAEYHEPMRRTAQAQSAPVSGGAPAGAPTTSPAGGDTDATAEPDYARPGLRARRSRKENIDA